MAWAPGIPLVPCTLGGSSTVEAGTDLVLIAEIRAVVFDGDGELCPVSMTWMADGSRYESAVETVTGAAGAQLEFELPPTDLPGWRDNASGMVIDVSAPGSHSHLYVIELVTKRGWGELSRRTIGPFPLPAGGLSPVDVDMLIAAGTVAGVLVSVPDAWSAQVAQAVAAAGSSDAAAASATAAGLSATAANTSAGIAAGSASTAAADAATATGAATVAEAARDLAEASAALAGLEITPSPDYPGTVLRIAYPAHVSPAPNLIRLPIGA